MSEPMNKVEEDDMARLAPPPAPVLPPTRFNAYDRCDRCGAQAYISATFTGHTALLFCVHHGRMHGERLRAQLATMFDESAVLEDSEKRRSSGR